MVSSKHNTGFTLIETLTTIAIFLVMIGGISLLFKTIFSGSVQEQSALSTVDQARIVESKFTNELRNANYGIDGSFPLNQASTSQIIFYTTFGGSSTTPNRIRYFLSGSSLMKGVIIPSGSPLSYTATSEVLSTVVTGVSNTSTPEFSYYNGNYAGTSSPLTQPVNVNQVTFVMMNLLIQKQDVRNATTTFSISGGAAIRSLKTNLGN